MWPCWGPGQATPKCISTAYHFEFKSLKKHVVANEEDGEGQEWEFGVIRCNNLYIKWINNKVILYSRGNYSQYPVINPHGEEYEQEYILHNWVSLLYSRNEYNIVNQLHFNKIFKRHSQCKRDALTLLSVYRKQNIKVPRERSPSLICMQDTAVTRGGGFRSRSLHTKPCYLCTWWPQAPTLSRFSAHWAAPTPKFLFPANLKMYCFLGYMYTQSWSTLQYKRK